MAQLVVADAAFKVYPGGVIVLRAVDWMGPARGTLVSVVDTRAITGQAVKDTQKVSNSIFSDAVGAYQAAADTLVIDLAMLPLEILPVPGMTYGLWASVLIEGDWDPANNDTYRGSNQHEFAFACAFGLHGVSTFTTSNPRFVHYQARNREHFILTMFGGLTLFEALNPPGTLRMRAYGRTATTIVYLIDQLFLVPFVLSGVRAGEWRPIDFDAVGGSYNDFASVKATDGPDGGDLNGKFTLQPYPVQEIQTNYTGGDGGGDYQRKSAYVDAERMFRITPGDFEDIENSQTGAEASAHGYSFGGVNYRPVATWVDDQFTRTANWPSPTQAGSSWGTTPEGFGWVAQTSPAGPNPTYAAVDGTKGIIHHGSFLNGTTVNVTLGDTDGTRARIRGEDFTFSGKFLVHAVDVPWFDGTTKAAIKMAMQGPLSGSNFLPSYYIEVDPLGKRWWLVRGDIRSAIPPASADILFGPVDISAWYAEDSYIGWKIEIKRFLIRVKLWDATGAEPGAWDFSGFRPLFKSPSWSAYPYGDDLDISARHSVFRPRVLTVAFDTLGQWETWWDDIKLAYDPYGDRKDVSVALERPEGTKIGEIVIPKGAQNMVYWGAKDWTEDDGFGSFVLVYSARTWNDPTAAELQRAEYIASYFRSLHKDFTLVSMNWRSSDRQAAARRVLVGS